MDGSAFRGLGDGLVVLFWLTCVAVIGFLALMGYVIFGWVMEPDWQREAIQRGYALYCPGSGEFAWKGECD